MKKVVMTVVGVLALAATANAQIWVNEYGSWYDNRTEWERLVTNVGTADYNYVSSSPTAVEENGVTATKTGPGSLITSTYLTSTQNNIPITFTFSGNAFSGQFSTTVAGSIDFSIDGSLTNIYNLTPTVSQAASGLPPILVPSASSRFANIHRLIVQFFLCADHRCHTLGCCNL